MTSPEITGNGVEVERKARRNAFEDHYERTPVRFTGSEKSHHAATDCIRSFCALSAGRHVISKETHERSRGDRLALTNLAVALAKADMQELVADRFVEANGVWIDVASGLPVHLSIAPIAVDRLAQMAWNDRCAEVARLRHPLINVLLDYGSADNEQTFEAYVVSPPLRAPSALVSFTLTHAVRFIEWRGVKLTHAVARALLRATETGSGSSRGRPLGVVLQPRDVAHSVIEALDDASPGGVSAIDICGAEGAGVRTLRTLIARAARLAGYVPVSSGVILRRPMLKTILRERHICVLFEEGHGAAERGAVAAFLADLGTSSARRHVLLKFSRGPRARGALYLDPMEMTAMRRMVFLDPDCGPSEEEVADAARVSGGHPGVFLRSLGAATFGEHTPRFSLVHESAPSYIVEPRPREMRGPLLNATDRAGRLARAGRHAAAIRLLNRASRVIHARGDSAREATCAEQLAWIARDRGRTDHAVEQFERAQAIAPEGAHRLRAAIGLGIVWTDQQRFLDAEAALRAARAAAELLNDQDVMQMASTALARCLYWQSRYDEAALSLEPWIRTPTGDVPASAWGLLARVRVGIGNLRGAVAAASEAVKRASQHGDLRAVASAARAMALVQAALGDQEQVRHCVERGLRAAVAAHLPLVALKLRIALLSAFAGIRPVADERGRLTHHLQSTLARQHLPPLIRAQIESALRGGSVGVHDRAVTELQDLLGLTQTAIDDRAAVEAICRLVLERLRAASVQIVTGGREPRVLVRSGRAWQHDTQLADQVLAGRSGVGTTGKSEPRRAAEPVRYGQETIAVVCCRWTAGTSIDDHHAKTVLAAAALAAAAPVRGLLDQPDTSISQGVCIELIGACPLIVSLREAIVRAARAPFPVLIEGESGSGKELVARGIHRLSQRRDRRLCTLNCAALADDLLEAELFGHARGAFTGAIGERPGLFEEADGGTIFLDEVGELSSRAQAKLLRVLQDGEIRRVGENMPRRVDARIIAATNRNLTDEVERGRFRADLRFRLDVVRIAVPPLRERAPDIPALATHFWAEATRRVGSSATLANEAVVALSRHDWPGNVRELQNVIASLAVHAPRRGRVTARLLPAHIASASVSSNATFEAARNEFERRFVRAALAQAGGQRARAARALGISRQGLTKMMRRLQIEV